MFRIAAASAITLGAELEGLTTEEIGAVVVVAVTVVLEGEEVETA